MISFVRASEKTIRTVFFDALEAPPQSRWRSSTQSSLRESKMGRVLRSSAPKNENERGSSIFGSEKRAGKGSSVFGAERSKTPHLRRTPSSAKNIPSSKNRPSSKYSLHRGLEPKIVEPPPPIFYFRSQKKNTPLFSIFDLRPRKSENTSIYDFRPQIAVRRSDGRQRGGGVRLLRRWAGVFRRSVEGSSIFQLRRKKNLPPSSTLSTRRTKNPPCSTFSARRIKSPTTFLFFRPPLSESGAQKSEVRVLTFLTNVLISRLAIKWSRRLWESNVLLQQRQSNRAGEPGAIPGLFLPT